MYERLPAPSDTVDIADVLRTLRRNSRAVLAFVGLGVAGAIALLIFAPRRFEGRATLLAKVGSVGSTSIVGRISGVGDLLGGLGSLTGRSEEHTSELQSQSNLVCRLLLEKKKKREK